jgi:trk system potassium uptake protein TrkH
MTLDLRVVLRHLALLMLILSALIAAVAVFAWVDHLTGEPTELVEPVGMLVAAFGGTLLGILLLLPSRRSGPLIAQREALLLVALSWLIGAAISALPFWLWATLRAGPDTPTHSFESFVNCYFEAMSGLTTTGSTILPAIGTVPPSLLLWRALTHWIGGLGIVVLFVAVLPTLGIGSRRAFRIESPGPATAGVVPRVRDTARVLWLIYAGLTVAGVLALRLAGMSWFNAVCHTFAGLSGGGFSTHDASITAFPATAIHLVIIAIMFLGAVDFALYYRLLHHQWREVLTDPQLRAYVAILLTAFLLVFLDLAYITPRPGSDGDTTGPAILARDALFQVVSVQTTTGYVTADFNQWGFLSKGILLCLMFIAGCAGSTSGGLKVIRILIVAKVLLTELERFYRPKVVRPVRVGTAAIDPALRLNTLVYVLAVAVLFGAGTALLMILERPAGIDITTAASATAATMNNVGPGLARVGAVENYAWFSAPSKVVICILMVLGRLEVFTILVLFTPRFWKGE